MVAGTPRSAPTALFPDHARTPVRVHASAREAGPPDCSRSTPVGRWLARCSPAAPCSSTAAPRRVTLSRPVCHAERARTQRSIFRYFAHVLTDLASCTHGLLYQHRTHAGHRPLELTDSSSTSRGRAACALLLFSRGEGKEEQVTRLRPRGYGRWAGRHRPFFLLPVRRLAGVAWRHTAGQTRADGGAASIAQPDRPAGHTLCIPEFQTATSSLILYYYIYLRVTSLIHEVYSNRRTRMLTN